MTDEPIFSGDFKVVICKSRVVKMKKYLPFCREFIILCVVDRVVVNHVV